MRKEVTKRIKLNKFVEGYWYGSSGNTADLLLHVDHMKHSIGVYKIGGTSPTVWQVINVICSDKDSLQELKWAVASYKRKETVSISCREGINGSKNISLGISEKDVPQYAIPWRKSTRCKLHISGCGKVESFNGFSGDVLEMIGFLKSEESEEAYVSFRTNLYYLVKNNTALEKREYRYTKYHQEPINVITEELCGYYAD